MEKSINSSTFNEKIKQELLSLVRASPDNTDTISRKMGITRSSLHYALRKKHYDLGFVENLLNALDFPSLEYFFQKILTANEPLLEELEREENEFIFSDIYNFSIFCISSKPTSKEDILSFFAKKDLVEKKIEELVKRKIVVKINNLFINKYSTGIKIPRFNKTMRFQEILIKILSEIMLKNVKSVDVNSAQEILEDLEKHHKISRTLIDHFSEEQISDIRKILEDAVWKIKNINELNYKETSELIKKKDIKKQSKKLKVISIFFQDFPKNL